MIQTNQSQTHGTKKDRKKDRKQAQKQSTESSSNENNGTEEAETITEKKPQQQQQKQKQGSNKQKVQQDPKMSKEHAKMLEAFWKLSEFNQNTRLDGIQQIVKYFNDLDSTKNKENYNYVLNRLIRGLASNRKCSRLGFSCCLTELINLNESLTFEYLIELAKANLKSTNDSTLTKEELRHMQIGLVFVYLCWIQSNRFDKTPSNTLKQIINDLNSYRTNSEFKTYIQQLYLQALVLLIKKINKFDLIFEAIDSDLKQNWDIKPDLDEQKIKDNLNLLLVCLNKTPESTNNYLKSNNLKLKTIFSANNFDLFYDILSQSTESLPNLQPLCTELIQYLAIYNPVYFKQLWSDLVDSKLSARKDLEKKLLSFKLFLFSFSLVNGENFKLVFYESLLASENVLQTFVHNYTNKQANLSELYREEMSKNLIEIVKVKEAELGEIAEASFGADLIIKLLGYVKNYHDMSDLISSLISNLNKSSLNKLFDFFINEFLKQDLDDFEKNKDEDETEKEIRKDQLLSKEIWLLNELTYLAKSSSTFKDNLLIKKILSYLSIHSYFDVLSNKAKLDQFEIGLNLIKNDKLVNNFRERLIECIGVILYKNNQFTDINVCSYTIIIDLVESIKKLIDQKSNSIKLTEKLLKKEQDLNQLCKRMINVLNDLLKNIKNQSIDELNKDVFKTFFMCVSIEFFRMFDSIKTSKQTLDDIEICIQKFNDDLNGNQKKKPNKMNKKSGGTSMDEEDDGDFEWIDMLVEMLLNLFTINTSWIRNAVKNQFKKLLPKLTVKSVKLIVDLLNPEADEDLVDEEDDDNVGEEMDDNDSYEGDEIPNDLNGDLFSVKGNGKNEEDESGVEDLSLSPSSVNDKTERKRKRKEVEEEDDEDEDEDDDDDDDDDEEDDEKSGVDEELKNSLLKALGNAAADEDNQSSDLDDEAMLKLDETIAQAFKIKKKDKKRQNELIQYKLRVLDFIQELFKSTYRLDLITYLIRPMLEILYESQTKPNLKSVSQRILGFLVNIKNTTKKITESKLPSVEELFDLLSHLIQSSTTHFNITNTLVETSMFSVRLIIHSANSCTDESEKNKILKKLNDIYLDIIKNDKSKINPIMYKEYLIRYPANSIPIIVQMIDTASMPDVKLHKKTMTLITLYQCVNSQTFNLNVDSKSSSLLIEKLFKFFDQMIDDLIKDDNLHIKFVDAFLNLVTRVLNLPKTLLKKEYNETLASKLTLFTKESKVKQAFKSRFLNLIQICHRI